MSVQRSTRINFEEVDTEHSLIRAVAGQDVVRIQLTGVGDDPKVLLSYAVKPAQALVLAHALAVAAGHAVQPQLPLFVGEHQARRLRFSSADLAEMRRLRASGILLREIARRFGCAVSTVARQTTGIAGSVAGPSQLLFHQMPLRFRPALVRKK